MAIHPRIVQPAKRDWTKVRLQHFPELTLLFNKELQIFQSGTPNYPPNIKLSNGHSVGWESFSRRKIIHLKMSAGAFSTGTQTNTSKIPKLFLLKGAIDCDVSPVVICLQFKTLQRIISQTGSLLEASGLVKLTSLVLESIFEIIGFIIHNFFRRFNLVLL